MLRISKLTDYAILVMVELVRARSEVVSANVLAERAQIELPTAILFFNGHPRSLQSLRV